MLFWALLTAPLVLQAQVPQQSRRVPPVLVKRVEPLYAPEALAALLEGDATFYVEITPDGYPTRPKLINSLGLGLDGQSFQAVQQYEYKPAERQTNIGIAVDVSFRIETEAVNWRVTRAGYTLHHKERGVSIESVVNPVLTRYQRPDPAACSGSSYTFVELGLIVKNSGTSADVIARETSGDAARLAAVAAASTWRFQPGKLNGKPHPFALTVWLECRGAWQSPVDPVLQLRPGGDVLPPAVIHKVEPEYSEEARRAKFQGSVDLALVVDPTGHATNIVIYQLLGFGLDAQAIAAVRQWHFNPAQKAGKPVPMTSAISFSFRLL